MLPSARNTGAPAAQRRKPPPSNGWPFWPQPTAALMPPCSPATTFCRRGRRWVRACSPISMPIHRRPILCATAAVVPEPRSCRGRVAGVGGDIQGRCEKPFGLWCRKQVAHANIEILLLLFAWRLWPAVQSAGGRPSFSTLSDSPLYARPYFSLNQNQPGQLSSLLALPSPTVGRG